jgi:hypothetical protein
MAMAMTVTMAGYKRGTDELGLERLAFLQIVGQALENAAEVAALLARADHGNVDLRELAGVLAQRPGKAGAGVDLGTQGGNQVALFLVFSLVGERRQRAFQRQARRNQSGNLAGPDGQFRGIEHARGEKATLGVGACGIGGSLASTGSTFRGTRACARNWLRAALTVSASMTPLRVCPWASSASNV